jgi:DNA invertase Pin-like site-specific DNA recombinase
MQKVYNVGIYTRLSVDDMSNSRKKKTVPADESVSIENQRLLLSKFCMISGWVETKVYIDDGYSGGNFQRPGFKRMVEDVKNGAINLILVKDLSRLGRDYIEVGRYTDVLFPGWGCRFVSLLDELDTSKEDNDMLHFRSLMNDYYLKDLSNKIKTVLYAKAKNGRFFTGQAHYGYLRGDEDKHLFVIDTEAAEVVRKIFELRLDGWGYGKIAGHLNNAGIPSPRDYSHIRKGKEIEKPTLWMYATIRDMLRQEAYIGNLVNFKEGNLSYKDKRKFKKPESEWIRYDNAHEAIIDRETWDRVRQIDIASAEKSKGRRKPQQSLFGEKLFCMDCGSTLVAHISVQHRKNGNIKRYTSYSCYRYQLTGYATCSWHTVSENPLKTLILSELQTHAQAITLDEPALLEKLKRAMALDDTKQQNLLRQEVKRLERRLDELERITAELYEDKVTRKISEVTFTALMEKNEQERQARQAQFDDTKAKLTAIEEKILSVSKWAEVVRKHIQLDDLCRADVDELIDHIEIGESDYSSGERRQEIRIYWQFIGHIPL